MTWTLDGQRSNWPTVTSSLILRIIVAAVAAVLIGYAMGCGFWRALAGVAGVALLPVARRARIDWEEIQ